MSWDDERIAKLHLARTSGIGPLTYARLLEEYGSAKTTLEALPERAKQAGRKLSIPDLSVINREIDEAEAFGAKIVFAQDDTFPDFLTKLAPPPSVLTLMGDASLASTSVVAMVGARNASAAAMRIAHDLAHDLGRAGWIISSGLARGIDTASHKGALKTGTIGVIAGGIDNVYPRQNGELYQAIRETGLIISEAPFGYEPKARDFPRRNRLITGLALGVVVVEAAEKSGSLISARTALEQGREVMAVPGSPLDPRSKGSNGLIRSGAVLVESAEHVLQLLSPMQSRQRDLFYESEPDYEEDETIENDTEIMARLEHLVSPVPVSIADLAQSANAPIRQCASALVELELAGKIKSLPGGLVMRAS